MPFLYGPKRPLRLGGIVSEVVEPKPSSGADCFIRRPDCGGHFDNRDLAQVIAHAGPPPHNGDLSRTSIPGRPSPHEAVATAPG